MRRSALLLALAFVGSASFAVAACGDDGGGTSSGVTPEGGDGDGSSSEGGGGDGGPGTDAPADAPKEGATDLDGATPDDGGGPDAGPPAVQLIGRFEKDGTAEAFAFPGSRIVARFNGTDATMTLTQQNGFSGGPSWFNLIVDGVIQAPFAVTGASMAYPVAVGLPLGNHTVQIEKRTEGNLGVVRFEAFTPTGGTGLLSPPARATRRIEFLSDSTIDGFGVEGDRVNAGAANFCGVGLAPPQFDNVRKSMALVASETLSAEGFVIGYSGKGLTKNGFGGDPLLFQLLYPRALPDSAGSAWNFASWTPDAVVISLGGVDFDGLTAEPAGFSAAYGGLVDTIRTNYGAGTHIFLTVWSQIKDDNIATRTAMKNSLEGIIAARAGDANLHYYQFPMANVNTDETGCQYHGNVAHHQAMAAALVTQIKAATGW